MRYVKASVGDVFNFANLGLGHNKRRRTDMHSWRTSFAWTGHLVLSLCSHLFLSWIPGSLLETWFSEEESD